MSKLTLAAITQQLNKEISEVAPIHGISLKDTSVRIDFKPEATAQERLDAQAVVDGFDFTKTRQRERSAIMVDLNSLSQDDLNTILKNMILDNLLSDPDYLINYGFSISGEE